MNNCVQTKRDTMGASGVSEHNQINGSVYYDEQELKEMLFSMKEHGCNIENAIREVDEEMNRKKIIESHPYKIALVENGKRWASTIVDAAGRKRYVKKVSRKELEDLIIKSQSNAFRMRNDTIGDLYKEWIRNKTISVSCATAVKYSSCWNKYFKDGALAAKHIGDITPIELQNDLIYIARKFSLTSRQCKEMKCIINQIYDDAVLLGLVSHNISRALRGFSSARRDYIASTHPKKKEDEVYSEEEFNKLAVACCQLFHKNKNTVYMAILMNFFLGLRVGELVALKCSDFNFETKTLHLSRSESRNYDTTNYQRVLDGFKINDYLKMHVPQRDVAITGGVEKLYNIIKSFDEKRGFESEWFLLNKRGGRMHTEAIHKALRAVCKEANIKPKSNHKIRKTYLSRLIASGLLSEAEVRDEAGHTDFATTDKYYVFTTSAKKDLADRIEKAVEEQRNQLEINIFK